MGNQNTKLKARLDKLHQKLEFSNFITIQTLEDIEDLILGYEYSTNPQDEKLSKLVDCALAFGFSNECSPPTRDQMSAVLGVVLYKRSNWNIKEQNKQNDDKKSQKQEEEKAGGKIKNKRAERIARIFFGVDNVQD